MTYSTLGRVRKPLPALLSEIVRIEPPVLQATIEQIEEGLVADVLARSVNTHHPSARPTVMVQSDFRSKRAGRIEAAD